MIYLDISCIFNLLKLHTKHKKEGNLGLVKQTVDKYPIFFYTNIFRLFFKMFQYAIVDNCKL